MASALNPRNQGPAKLFSVLGHELRSPLTTILGFAELLLDPDLGVFERREAVRNIRRATEQLSGVVEDMTEYAALQEPGLKVTPVTFAPGELLKEMESAFRLRAKERSIKLESRWIGGEAPGGVTADAARLRRAMVRMVSHLVATCPEGTMVLFGRFYSGAAPRISLGVEAPGAAPSLDSITHSPDPRTLSLSVAARTAELLGGTFDAMGESPAILTLTVPVAAVNFKADAPALTQEHAADPTRPLAGRNYLVCEDAVETQRLLNMFLTKAGATVRMVNNGREALEAGSGATTPFDLILMDMQTPEMDGYEATRRLRAGGYKGLILALTANATSTDRQLCLEAGCDDFIAKPVDRKQLIERLARLTKDLRRAA